MLTIAHSGEGRAHRMCDYINSLSPADKTRCERILLEWMRQATDLRTPEGRTNARRLIRNAKAVGIEA